MPALSILPPTTPHSPRTTRATYPHDWEPIWVLVTVLSILVVEVVLALSWLRIHNLRCKARWKNLRERGVVVVNGPSLIWVENLPLRRTVSHFNLREVVEVQKEAELSGGEEV
jgi:hypothetical protein